MEPADDRIPTAPPSRISTGYKIYWGSSAGSYPSSVTVNNPGLSSYVVDNLMPGTHFFAVTVFNSSGTESGFSNTASKTTP